MRLISLQFHSESTESATIPLRKNEDPGSLYLSPEWRHGLTCKPEDSPLAVMLSGLSDSNSFSIRATVGREETIKTGEIRVVAGSHDNLLTGGELTSSVKFQVNQSLASSDVILKVRTDAGVTCHDDALEWQFRQDSRSQWCTFATTVHRVYLLLDRPGSPWSLRFAEADRWVWTDALDVATVWAHGAQSVDAAAGLVTQSVYELGQRPEDRGGLRYASDLAQYVSRDRFFCSDFLAHLRGAPDWPSLVNCFDLSSIVSTFANAIGCELHQGQLTTSALSFQTNLVLAIGLPPPQVFHFRKHAQTWNGTDASSQVLAWDGCLGLNDSLNPSQQPFHLSLARGFTVAQYRTLLIQPLPPNPTLSIRQENRHISRSASLASGDQLLALISGSRPSQSEALRAPQHAHANHFLFLGFTFDGTEFEGFRLLRATAYYCDPAHERYSEVFDTFWRRVSDDAAPTIRVTIEVTATPESAQQTLRDQFDNVPAPPMVVDGIGDSAFKTEAGAVVFSRANAVALVSSVRWGAPSDIQQHICHALDKQLMTPPVESEASKTLALTDGVALIDPDQLLPRTGRPGWCRLSTTTGSLALEDGKAIYRAGAGDNHEVRLFRRSSLPPGDRDLTIDLR